MPVIVYFDKMSVGYCETKCLDLTECLQNPWGAFAPLAPPPDAHGYKCSLSGQSLNAAELLVTHMDNCRDEHSTAHVRISNG